MKEIILPVSQNKAILHERITYGQQLEIESTLTENLQADGKGGVQMANLGKWKRQKLKTVVEKIICPDGTEVKVCDASLDELDAEDGKFLEMAVEEVLTTGKKN